MRRDDVVSTLIRRHFGTTCPLGQLTPVTSGGLVLVWVSLCLQCFSLPTMVLGFTSTASIVTRSCFCAVTNSSAFCGPKEVYKNPKPCIILSISRHFNYSRSNSVRHSRKLVQINIQTCCRHWTYFRETCFSYQIYSLCCLTCGGDSYYFFRCCHRWRLKFGQSKIHVRLNKLKSRGFRASSLSRFLLSPLADKRDKVIKNFAQCMCVHLWVRPSGFVRTITCTIIQWISKQVGTVVALEEEKYHLKHLF